MPERARRAYIEWQEADARAKLAEERLREAWVRYELLGAPPSEEALDEVRMLRDEANKKLVEAVRLMRG